MVWYIDKERKYMRLYREDGSDIIWVAINIRKLVSAR